jgi:hypothetical protein
MRRGFSRNVRENALAARHGAGGSACGRAQNGRPKHDALKGRNTTAQGNALGQEADELRKP